MKIQDRQTRAGDFRLQAEAYARARPGYPPQLVEILTSILGLGADDAVAEIGAGTGLFTSCLAAAGLRRLSALEPNEAMRSKAQGLDGVTWSAGTFEETGLETASQAWIIAAQAFHWADPERALPELHRVLVPDGALTVLWNERNVAASPILTETHQLIEEMVPRFDEGYRHRDWDSVLSSTGHFSLPICLGVPHVITMSRERYLDLWRSHNLLNTAAGPEKMDRFLDALEKWITEHLGEDDLVDVPYTCRVYTSRAKKT